MQSQPGYSAIKNYFELNGLFKEANLSVSGQHALPAEQQSLWDSRRGDLSDSNLMPHVVASNIVWTHSLTGVSNMRPVDQLLLVSVGEDNDCTTKRMNHFRQTWVSLLQLCFSSTTWGPLSPWPCLPSKHSWVIGIVYGFHSFTVPLFSLQ